MTVVLHNHFPRRKRGRDAAHGASTRVLTAQEQAFLERSKLLPRYEPEREDEINRLARQEAKQKKPFYSENDAKGWKTNKDATAYHDGFMDGRQGKSMPPDKLLDLDYRQGWYAGQAEKMQQERVAATNWSNKSQHDK